MMRDPVPPVSGKNGAPMGRPGNPGGQESGKFYLVRVRINSGGYDRGGAYWGIGEPLYYFEGPEGVSGYLRGRTRHAAKEQVRKQHPEAEFFQ